jgi:hypothetical protein
MRLRMQFLGVFTPRFLTHFSIWSAAALADSLNAHCALDSAVFSLIWFPVNINRACGMINLGPIWHQFGRGNMRCMNHGSLVRLGGCQCTSGVSRSP